MFQRWSHSEIQPGTRLRSQTCTQIKVTVKTSSPASSKLTIFLYSSSLSLYYSSDVSLPSGAPDVDECLTQQHNCSRGTTCINTGGGFQCVNPECPRSHGNVSYVKTSPLWVSIHTLKLSRTVQHIWRRTCFTHKMIPLASSDFFNMSKLTVRCTGLGHTHRRRSKSEMTNETLWQVSIQIYARCNFVPVDWTRDTHEHDVTVFTNSSFCWLHGDDNGIIFKNVHFDPLNNYLIRYLLTSRCT